MARAKLAYAVARCHQDVTLSATDLWAELFVRVLGAFKAPSLQALLLSKLLGDAAVMHWSVSSSSSFACVSCLLEQLKRVERDKKQEEVHCFSPLFFLLCFRLFVPRFRGTERSYMTMTVATSTSMEDTRSLLCRVWRLQVAPSECLKKRLDRRRQLAISMATCSVASTTTTTTTSTYLIALIICRPISTQHFACSLLGSMIPKWDSVKIIFH